MPSPLDGVDRNNLMLAYAWAAGTRTEAIALDGHGTPTKDVAAYLRVEFGDSTPSYLDRIAGIDRPVEPLGTYSAFTQLDERFAAADLAGATYLAYVRAQYHDASLYDDELIFDPPLDTDPIAVRLLGDVVTECSLVRMSAAKQMRKGPELPPGFAEHNSYLLPSTIGIAPRDLPLPDSNDAVTQAEIVIESAARAGAPTGTLRPKLLTAYKALIGQSTKDSPISGKEREMFQRAHAIAEELRPLEIWERTEITKQLMRNRHRAELGLDQDMIPAARALANTSPALTIDQCDASERILFNRSIRVRATTFLGSAGLGVVGLFASAQTFGAFSGGLAEFATGAVAAIAGGVTGHRHDVRKEAAFNAKRNRLRRLRSARDGIESLLSQKAGANAERATHIKNVMTVIEDHVARSLTVSDGDPGLQRELGEVERVLGPAPSPSSENWSTFARLVTKSAVLRSEGDYPDFVIDSEDSDTVRRYLSNRSRERSAAIDERATAIQSVSQSMTRAETQTPRFEI